MRPQLTWHLPFAVVTGCEQARLLACICQLMAAVEAGGRPVSGAVPVPGCGTQHPSWPGNGKCRTDGRLQLVVRVASEQLPQDVLFVAHDSDFKFGTCPLA
jgi:hypothetical protein